MLFVTLIQHLQLKLTRVDCNTDTCLFNPFRSLIQWFVEVYVKLNQDKDIYLLRRKATQSETFPRKIKYLGGGSFIQENGRRKYIEVIVQFPLLLAKTKHMRRCGGEGGGYLYKTKIQQNIKFLLCNFYFCDQEMSIVKSYIQFIFEVL